MKVDGRCHCGSITFEAEADPENTAACHCTDCQRLTGAPYRVTVRVPGDKFRLLTGKLTIYEKTAESGAKRLQAFCPTCGSSIYATAAGDGPKDYGLRLGTFNESQRAAFVPRRQMWCRSAQSWATGLPGVKFEKGSRPT